MPAPFVKALQMLRRDAPWFSEQIKHAQQSRTALTLSLQAFDDNPILLYAALYVASRARVVVYFLPLAEETDL